MGIMGLTSPGMGTVAQIVNLCGHRPVVRPGVTFLLFKVVHVIHV